MEAAAAIMGVGPAYQALLAEAQVDAGVRHGLRPELAGQLVAQTMAGSAALLRVARLRHAGGAPRRDLAGWQHGAWPGGARGRGNPDRLSVGDRRCHPRRHPLMLAEAVTRVDIANYVSALFTVYIVLIFLYILLNLLFSFGVRLPYARWSDAVLTFLRDVCEPYLRLFRRFIPPLGVFDFSPIIAIFVLYIVRTLVVNAISG